MSDKIMAVIKGVQIGVGDRGVAWLSFSVYPEESLASLQILSWEDAKVFIEAYGVSDVSKLNGKPVWIKRGGGCMEIVGPCIV